MNCIDVAKIIYSRAIASATMGNACPLKELSEVFVYISKGHRFSTKCRKEIII